MVRRWYWKLYLYLMVLLNIGMLGLVVFYSSGEAASFEPTIEWAAMPMYLMQVVGLFGFVYWRRIGSSRIWKLVLAVTVLDILWSTYSMVIDFEPIAGMSATFLFVMFTTLLTAIYLPLFIALYIYAFRSDDMWSHPQPA